MASPPTPPCALWPFLAVTTTGAHARGGRWLSNQGCERQTTVAVSGKCAMPCVRLPLLAAALACYRAFVPARAPVVDARTHCRTCCAALHWHCSDQALPRDVVTGQESWRRNCQRPSFSPCLDAHNKHFLPPFILVLWCRLSNTCRTRRAHARNATALRAVAHHYLPFAYAARVQRSVPRGFSRLHHAGPPFSAFNAHHCHP